VVDKAFAPKVNDRFRHDADERFDAEKMKASHVRKGLRRTCCLEKEGLF
jgi:hypothetical protein